MCTSRSRSFSEHETRAPGSSASVGGRRRRGRRASDDWLLGRSLSRRHVPWRPTRRAFVRRVDGEPCSCARGAPGCGCWPGCSRSGTSMPDEVAEAFVPRTRPAGPRTSSRPLGEDHPEIRSHILHANWHVPLRWFAAFDDSERVLTEDKEGCGSATRPSSPTAKARLGRALDGPRDSLDRRRRDRPRSGSSTSGSRSSPRRACSNSTTARWPRIFPDDELVEDHSAAEVWACLEALEAGDVIRAGTDLRRAHRSLDRGPGSRGRQLTPASPCLSHGSVLCRNRTSCRGLGGA